ncbi:MAG: Gfo/Idh/MocA family oxidoreductase [Treponema sp.]|nr:Gfo/Idh/MocA family oxidoreductase [Treponema sp.]
MEQIRLGIIGMGNMGSGHFRNVQAGKCPSVKITAICDINPDKLKDHKDLESFTDADKMLESGLVDAVLIAVPHYLHPDMAIKAFNHKVHVLTEKPAGVYARQVREMNEAAKKSGVKFGIMFNQRTNPLYAKAREIVQSGQLGELKRFVWIITNWYRTQAYYDSGSWRATWAGEGGGVLLNQAPHNLDLWQWIFGMPKRVRAFCSFGKYHKIDVEDDVTIYGEYENGASAVFITTTGEAPGTNRLEISGDKGKLVIEDAKLKWWKLDEAEREFCFTAKEGFITPKNTYQEFSEEAPEGHPEVLEAFAKSILTGSEMIARGEEGLNSLSISNAAYISSWTDDWAEIPTKEELFEKKLAELSAKEKENPRKK